MVDEVKTKKNKKKEAKKQAAEGIIYIKAGYNNTIVTITDLQGNTLIWSSAGKSGFKGSKKATPYAAQIAAEKAGEEAKIVHGMQKARVFIKGVGNGREQAIRGLHSAGIEIDAICDITPLPHNGCRPRKSRRV